MTKIIKKNLPVTPVYRGSICVGYLVMRQSERKSSIIMYDTLDDVIDDFSLTSYNLVIKDVQSAEFLNLYDLW